MDIFQEMLQFIRKKKYDFKVLSNKERSEESSLNGK